jgi:hypothetical protein
MTSAAKHIPDWMLDWARLEPHLENALEYAGGTHATEDVFLGVVTGDYQFWPGEDSVIITEVIEFPQKTVLHYFLAGGNLGELEQMADEIEQWARREEGIDSITLTGRKGWSRSFLRNKGYGATSVSMSKELNDE